LDQFDRLQLLVFTPTKINVIFFKTETPTYIDTFDKLKAKGLDLDASTCTGLDNSIGSSDGAERQL
jgi:hypothetical protein